MKKFGKKWFLGTVDDVVQDEKTVLWHVSYTDFDGEEMDLQQLASHIHSHPLLDSSADLETPELNSMVWYSEQGRPAIGRVIHIDPTVARPLMVQRYREVGQSTFLHKARFEEVPADESGEPNVARITLHQVRMAMKSLTKTGRLIGSDQHRLRKLLVS